MKRLSFSLLAIIILSFVIVQSCSTEEEESVAPVVQTPQPEPEPDPVEYSLTVSAADGGTVSTEGGTYDEGTEVTITATANEGYRFTGWEGNSSTSESLTVTLNSNQTYQAIFELIPIYTLTVTTSEGGTVSTEGGEFEEGTEVEIIATPNEGYQFIGWEESASVSETLIITLDSNKTYQALFELIPIYTLTVTTSEGGTVSSEGGEYEEGTEVELTATPNEGYEFVGWEGNDSGNSDLTITLNSNLTIQPIFQIVAVHNILFMSGYGGSIKITGENIEEQGVELLYAINQTEINVEAIPEPGYFFAGWISNSGVTLFSEKLHFPTEYQFLNSNNNITLNASFAPNLIDEAPPNPISELDISNLEGIQGRDGYNFYYNISDNLPIDWINEFKIIMGNLNSVVHITPRVKISPRDGKDEMHIFAWNSNEESPFTAIIGNYGGACICGNQNVSYMVLEINNNEFIYNEIHRYSVIAHEYFHAYQINASIVQPPYLKYLFEGGAATFESLYIQQYYNINYFLDAFTSVSQLAIDSPILFETYDDVSEINGSDSVFIFLALVKEIQKQGNTEIQAFKKVYVDWWKSGRTDVTKEVLFEEVFGFSIDSFYLALKSYNPNINSILPSQSIRLQDIFTE